MHDPTFVRSFERVADVACEPQGVVHREPAAGVWTGVRAPGHRLAGVPRFKRRRGIAIGSRRLHVRRAGLVGVQELLERLAGDVLEDQVLRTGRFFCSVDGRDIHVIQRGEYLSLPGRSAPTAPHPPRIRRAGP